MLLMAWKPGFMQTAYTVLIRLMLVGVSRLVGRMYPLPLPRVQIAVRALRAQRLELYSLRRHHQIGDDVRREVSGELDLSEADLGHVK